MRETKEINFIELGVAARSKQFLDIGEERGKRINLVITDADTVYKIAMSKSNARYLIDKLSLAVELAK